MFRFINYELLRPASNYMSTRLVPRLYWSAGRTALRVLSSIGNGTTKPHPAKPASDNSKFRSADFDQEGPNKKRRTLIKYVVPLALLAGVFHLVGYAARRFKSEAHSNGNDSSKKEATERRRGGDVELEAAIQEARALLSRFKVETLSPGMTIAVTIDGKPVWTEGLGLADVESDVPCTPRTVMRIASISKPLTMTLTARLWQEGRLDLDAHVQQYVPAWPDKVVDGRKVTITTRHLVSMISGIRHYDRDCDRGKKDKAAVKSDDEKKEKKKKNEKKEEGVGEFSHKEYYIRRHYDSVTEALGLFKDDPLCSAPGTEYLYSTHGYTLLSAVLEGVTGKGFPLLMQRLFLDLGLNNTRLEHNDPLLYGRARYYRVDGKRRLVNAPYVDNSYKWAGGGFVSTASDLCRFGNAMLYSYQQPPDDDNRSHDNRSPGDANSEECKPSDSKPGSLNQRSAAKSDLARSIRHENKDSNRSDSAASNPIAKDLLTQKNMQQSGSPLVESKPQTSTNSEIPQSTSIAVVPQKSSAGFLSRETMRLIWQPVELTSKGFSAPDNYYAMGWGTTPSGSQPAYCRDQRMFVAHTGGAVGASSVLLILPRREWEAGGVEADRVRGVVVAIIVNMQGVGMQGVALQVARIFDRVVHVENVSQFAACDITTVACL